MTIHQKEQWKKNKYDKSKLNAKLLCENGQHKNFIRSWSETKRGDPDLSQAIQERWFGFLRSWFLFARKKICKKKLFVFAFSFLLSKIGILLCHEHSKNDPSPFTWALLQSMHCGTTWNISISCREIDKTNWWMRWNRKDLLGV